MFRCVLFVVYCVLLVVGLIVTRCVFFADGRYSRLAACCSLCPLLFVVCGLLFVVRRVLFVVCCLMCDASSLLLVVSQLCGAR